MLNKDGEVVRLADAYLKQEIVPTKKRDDALHVACATVFEMDVLFRGILSTWPTIRLEARFAVVNQTEGFWRSPRILSPLEVEDEEYE